MNETQVSEIAKEWDKHLETQLIIRIYTRENASRYGASHQIRILAYDNVTPVGYYYIEYGAWDPSPNYAQQSPPLFEIERLVATETETPIQLAISAMHGSFLYEGLDWMDPRPALSIRLMDKSTTVEEHLNIGAYAQMISLHTMLMCRDKFLPIGMGKLLNNRKTLQSVIRKLEGFLSSERAKLAKMRNIF